MSKKLTLIKLFVFTGYLGIPTSAFLLFLFSSKSWAQLLFLGFVIFHSLERVTETFFTTKERRGNEFHGDWTLALVTIAYVVLCFLTIAEFYLMKYQRYQALSVIGVGLYCAAFLLRRWGMRSLGKQWAIHAVGARKIKKVRVIKVGAYKYMRHPIYLGIILEVLSLPMIASAFYSIGLAAFINVPLQYLRLLMEEKSSVRRFGDRYIQYMNEVSMLLPLKYLRNKWFSHDIVG